MDMDFRGPCTTWEHFLSGPAKVHGVSCGSGFGQTNCYGGNAGENQVYWHSLGCLMADATPSLNAPYDAAIGLWKGES